MISNGIIILLIIGILLIFFRKKIIYLYHTLRSNANGGKSNHIINLTPTPNTPTTLPNPPTRPKQTEHFEDNFIPSQTFQGKKDNYVFKTMVYQNIDNKSSKERFTNTSNRPYKYKIGYYKDTYKQ